MLRFMKKRSSKIGLPPGEAVYIGKSCLWTPQWRIIDFDADNLEECETSETSHIASYQEKSTVTWIDVSGIHRVEAIKKLSDIFKWHALVVEDVVNTDHPCKLEEYGDYIFLVLKMIRFDESTKQIDKEQISVIFGLNYVATFREKKDELWKPIINRLRFSKGRIRRMGADYLAYVIVDLVVDYYFEVLEKLGLEIEDLEDELIRSPQKIMMNHIHSINKELLLFRKTVWPLREVAARMAAGEHDLIQDTTLPFMRDLHDHVIQVIDTGESFREVIANLLNLYMSQISNRMNEIMKVLTIFAAIFIPLTFMAGVYGMNFDHMPELHAPYGYPILLGAMLAVTGGMLYFFRRKNWL